MLGKQPLYLSMLRQFVAGQKSVVAEIIKALDGNSGDTAERLAHTLKGVCGTIGATGLKHLAEKLEAAIRECRPSEEIAACLDEVKMPLGSLLTQLEKKLLKEWSDADVTVAPEQLQAVCDHLKALLADDDAEAYDVLNAHADLLSAAFPSHYLMIADAIRAFDFNAALIALKAATGTSV